MSEINLSLGADGKNYCAVCKEPISKDQSQLTGVIHKEYMDVNGNQGVVYAQIHLKHVDIEHHRDEQMNISPEVKDIMRLVENRAKEESLKEIRSNQ